MKHYQILYSVALLFISFITYGQENSTLVFEETDHDFGDIQEADGPAIYEFVFENKGETPVIISGVRASCGCTTPAWSKEPVLPGDKGFIKAQYNPRNRPGSFRKTLTVTTNAEPSRLYLYIKGKVIPRVKTVEERMPYKIGDLRMENRTLNFSKITTKAPVEKSYEVYNDGKDTLRFVDKMEGADFIKITLVGKALAPKQTGKMTVWYNPDHDENLGFNENAVSFYTDEAENPKKDIVIRATISEYFEPLSPEEKEKAPVLQIAERMKDLGNVATGQKATETFVLANAGKEKLNIRKVETNCTCLVAELEDENIKGGGETTLTVTFDPEKRRGRQTKSVTIYSNDPNDPTQMVTVKTMVVAGN